MGFGLGFEGKIFVSFYSAVIEGDVDGFVVGSALGDEVRGGRKTGWGECVGGPVVEMVKADGEEFVFVDEAKIQDGFTLPGNFARGDEGIDEVH